jgi:hypothetical protein
MLDFVVLEFAFDAGETLYIRNADQDDVGHTFDTGMFECKMENGMIRLDDLMLNRKISPNEDVNVGFRNLGHKIKK